MMILKFLRLFAAFRETERIALENRLLVIEWQGRAGTEAEGKRRVEAEACEWSERFAAADDRERFWTERAKQAEARADHWEAKYQESNAARIKSVETTADFVSQLRFGRKIYDHSPVLPEKRPEDYKPIMKDRVQARAQVQAAERKFDQDLKDYYDRKAQQAQVGAGLGDLPNVNGPATT